MKYALVLVVLLTALEVTPGYCLLAYQAPEVKDSRSGRDAPGNFSIGDHDTRPPDITGAPGWYQGTISHTLATKDGKRRAFLAVVMSREGDSWQHFPPLATDDVVSVFGSLYRVSEVHEQSIVFERVDDEKLTKDCAAAADSCVAPLRRPDIGELNLKRQINVMKIEESEDHGSEFKASIITNSYRFDAKKDAWTTDEKSFDVREGGEFRVENSPLLSPANPYDIYEVLKIVPRDEKTGVTGWIELKRTTAREKEDKE